MIISPTLTSDEFKKIHNALCEIGYILPKLEDVLKPDLYEKLVKAKNDIDSALSRAYDEEDCEFETREDHYSEISQENNFDSIWSIHEVKNLHEAHPYLVAKTLVYKNHWGTQTIEVPIEGSTWLDMYRAADNAIRKSSDRHHVFIEDFLVSSNDHSVVFLSTGS